MATKPIFDMIWTAAEAEAELKDFKFNGPGWYHIEDHTEVILVAVPLERKDCDEKFWDAAFRPNEKFRFMVIRTA